jgi:hypothetical protein
MSVKLLNVTVAASLAFALMTLSGCTLWKPAEFKPVLPTEERDLPNRSFDELKQEIRSFDRTIGGYPPRFEYPEEREETYQYWSEALIDIRAFLKTEGETERVLWALSELYRQGHNMDVEGAGAAAVDANARCLVKFPQSILCHFSATYLYLAVAPTPEHLGQAEKSLDFLRRKYAPKVSEEVEDGYVYLYVYQRKPGAAIKQIDRYLSIFPKSPKRDLFLKLRAAIKANKPIYPGGEIPGPTGAGK